MVRAATYCGWSRSSRKMSRKTSRKSATKKWITTKIQGERASGREGCAKGWEGTKQKHACTARSCTYTHTHTHTQTDTHTHTHTHTHTDVRAREREGERERERERGRQRRRGEGTPYLNAFCNQRQVREGDCMEATQAKLGWSAIRKRTDRGGHADWRRKGPNKRGPRLEETVQEKELQLAHLGLQGPERETRGYAVSPRPGVSGM